MAESSAWVILNPTSGQEKAVDVAPLIEAKLREYFDRVEIRITEKAGDARDYAKAACEAKIEAVFAVGGDGTVNEVLSGMADEVHRPKLGIFPAGTFNALARLLRIPLKLEQAIEHFTTELQIPIDIGQVNDQYFAYVLSIGEIPDAIHEVEIEEKSDFGVFAYFKQIAKRMRQIDPFKLQLKIDDAINEVEISHLVILLADRLGSLKFIEDGSNLNDGEMNLLLIKSHRFMEILSLIPDFITGQIEKNEQIDLQRVKQLEIHASDIINCDIDGDEGPMLPLKIQVLPQHIQAYYGSEVLIDSLEKEN